jgi:aryl-alcohol dehydrogenase-like predicted oxidoreductase
MIRSQSGLHARRWAQRQHETRRNKDSIIMQTRRLGNTDLEITPIGFGAWAIGGDQWAYGWGPQDDRDSIAAIGRALELGINWIDTAAVYGFGHSEEVIAEALAGVPLSSRPYIFTKCSLLAGDKGMPVHSLDPASIRQEVEASLHRLRVDTIDLYQIHWPAFPPEHADQDQIASGWRCLVDLKQSGKVRHIGVSNFDRHQLELIREIAPVSSLQPPYSMLMRDIEQDVLPYCEQHGIGVIVYSPMQSGLLSGAMTRKRIASLPDTDWRKASMHFQEPNLSANLALVEVLREIGQRYGRSAGEVAIAWTLRNPAVTGAIVGARHPAQIDGVAGAMQLRLSAPDLERIAQALPPSAGLF